MKTYEVTIFFKKLSEGLKPYKPGDKIKLSDEEAKPLIETGRVKPIKKEKAKENKKAPVTKKKNHETK